MKDREMIASPKQSHSTVGRKTDPVSREMTNKWQSHLMYLQIRWHVRSNIYRHKSHSIIVCVYQVKLWGKCVGATTNFWDWKMAGINEKEKINRYAWCTQHFINALKKHLGICQSTARRCHPSLNLYWITTLFLRALVHTMWSPPSAHLCLRVVSPTSCLQTYWVVSLTC